MSLAPGEQRSLAEIESQLSRSDPRLAKMFARFTADGLHTRSLLQLPPRSGLRRGARARVVILVIVSMTLFIMCVAVAVSIATHGAQPGGRTLPGASQAGLHAPEGPCSGRVACSK